MEVRKYSNKLMELIETGVLDPVDVVRMCVKWMSEDDVQGMMEANEIEYEYPEEEDEEEEPASYLLFAGETKDSLYPLKAFRDKDEAIADAKETVKLGCPCAEVCYMPEDDADTNEVVWSNCGRK
jgi:hypothetical protein